MLKYVLRHSNEMYRTVLTPRMGALPTLSIVAHLEWSKSTLVTPPDPYSSCLERSAALAEDHGLSITAGRTMRWRQSSSPFSFSVNDPVGC